MVARMLFIFVVSIVLAGCAEQQGDSQQKSMGASDFSKRYASAVLPPGVNLVFPFELISERLYTREDSGETRRGLMLEFLEVEPSRVVEEVHSAFAEAGYRARGADVVRSDGRTSITLIKSGSPSIFVDIQPVGDRTLNTPNALGTVWLSWRVRDGLLDRRASGDE